MPAQDTSQIKEKIISLINRRGPCLPVHIASEISTNTLFASAFLSELVSEKKIKMSYMKIGSSPIYFIPGQEYLLERYSQHLRSRERDAFELLRKNKFLVDSKQEPAIRVALRSLRDFAIPSKEGEEIIWRYHTERENILKSLKPEIQEEKSLDILEEKKEPKEQIKKAERKTPIKKSGRKVSASQKKDEKFFNKVKEFLTEKSIGIEDIESFSKSDLILRIIDKGVEKLLIAYNKKRITETEILKAYKKASEENLPYVILSFGEFPKKLGNLIDALKKMSWTEKIE